MIKTIPFTEKDLNEMDLRDHEVELLKDPSYMEELKKCEDSRIIVVNGKKVCAVGILGVDVWIIPVKDMNKYAISVSRTIRRLMEPYKFLRTLCIYNAVNSRWMHFLGFEAKDWLKLSGTEYCLYEIGER